MRVRSDGGESGRHTGQDNSPSRLTQQAQPGARRGILLIPSVRPSVHPQRGSNDRGDPEFGRRSSAASRQPPRTALPDQHRAFKMRAVHRPFAASTVVLLPCLSGAVFRPTLSALPSLSPHRRRRLPLAGPCRPPGLFLPARAFPATLPPRPLPLAALTPHPDTLCESPTPLATPRGSSAASSSLSSCV